jgi:hypothetical protein
VPSIRLLAEADAGFGRRHFRYEIFRAGDCVFACCATASSAAGLTSGPAEAFFASVKLGGPPEVPAVSR